MRKLEEPIIGNQAEIKQKNEFVVMDIANITEGITKLKVAWRKKSLDTGAEKAG